jgi:hypothetical protein
MSFPLWYVKPHHKRTFWRRHSLSFVSGGIVLMLILLYKSADPDKHLGSFFGNAIADWTGVFVMIVVTKWFYEVGSEESKKCPKGALGVLRRHSLTIFLLITGVLLVCAFAEMEVNGKWGQVVGNLVSEWTQILGTVLMTKWFIEVGSKESKK